MGGQVDVFGGYVALQLDEWGREFALHRDCEYLGHQSKNLLQVLIDHRGEMPARATGFKPMEVNSDAMAIERIVTDIARTNVAMAHCLRAYHCGQGRRRNERWHQANGLLAKTGRRLTRAQYMDLVHRGFDEVRHRLLDVVRTG